MYNDIMTKALYIHGFASSFQPDSPKMQALSTKFDLCGVNVDYSLGFDDVAKRVADAITEHGADILIGTSMGGYTAQRLGDKFGFPWVAINPATNPGETLKGRVPDEVLGTYAEDATFKGAGMVILDLGDEVLDSHATRKMIPESCTPLLFEGGNHRFQHMDEAVHYIESFYNRVFSSYA